MDTNNLGPSNPKRRLTEADTDNFLTFHKLEELYASKDSDLEPFQESESEEDSSSGEEEEEREIRIDTGADENIPIWENSPNIKNIPFRGIPGLKVDLKTNDPIDFANLFFTDEFINHLLMQTNSKAEKVFLRIQTKEKSRITQWKPVTASEMKVFLGLWLHMGHIHINHLQDYWKTDELYNIPCFRNHMSRNRFLLILRCLNFCKNPNKGEPKDSLSKISWLQDYFNNQMDELYYPHKNLLIDESMILSRGSLSDIKLHMLTEPGGIALKLKISHGMEDIKSQMGHSNIVFDLLGNYLQNGHSIYMNNSYNSITLCQELLNQGTYVSGMLRKNQKCNPKELISKKLAKGEVITKHANGVTVGKWQDKREVFYVSTEFDGQLVKDSNKRGEIKQKPNIVVNYHKNMMGIDKQDQMISYNSERKTIKWYKKLGIHIMSIMLLNSCQLYNTFSTKPKLSYYDFRHHIIKKFLLQKDSDRKKLLNVLHVPEKMKQNENHQQMRKRCRVCYREKIRKNTPYYCPSCREQPGLCLGECFRIYHQNK